MTQLWIKNDEGQLCRIVSSSYALESDLQNLVSSTPEILAEALDPDSNALQLLLVADELKIGYSDDAGNTTTWSLDHLFLGSDAIPTLVEDKRSADPRIRREVLGQLLEYAASFSHDWDVPRLKARLAHQHPESDDLVQDFALQNGQFETTGDYWNAVEHNLTKNRLRLVFIADRLPPRLIRVIEFLNAQMAGTEVIGIEITPHEIRGGDKHGAFVVSTHGGQPESEPSSRSKSAAPRRTRAEFDAILLARQGQSVADGFTEFASEMESMGFTISIGTQEANPQLFFNYQPDIGDQFWTISLRPKTAKMHLQLRSLERRAPFADEEVRAQLVDNVRLATGQPIPNPNLSGYPSTPTTFLTDPNQRTKMLQVMKWCIETNDSYYKIPSDETQSSTD